MCMMWAHTDYSLALYFALTRMCFPWHRTLFAHVWDCNDTAPSNCRLLDWKKWIYTVATILTSYHTIGPYFFCVGFSTGKMWSIILTLYSLLIVHTKLHPDRYSFELLSRTYIYICVCVSMCINTPPPHTHTIFELLHFLCIKNFLDILYDI